MIYLLILAQFWNLSNDKYFIDHNKIPPVWFSCEFPLRNYQGGYFNELQAYFPHNFIDKNQYCLDTIFYCATRLNKRFAKKINKQKYINTEYAFYLLRKRVVHVNLSVFEYSFITKKPTQLDEELYRRYFEHGLNFRFLNELSASIVTCKIAKSLGYNYDYYLNNSQLLLKYLIQIEAQYKITHNKTYYPIKNIRQIFEKELADVPNSF